MIIDKMYSTDWDSVKKIYKEGIDTQNATFEQTVPDWQTWDKNHLPECRLVIRNKNQVIGWAALSSVSTREVYRGVAEVSIYITASARGLGYGSQLFRSLIEVSEKNKIWTLQSGIFPENKISISLHKSFGFREIGVREKIGKMNDVWRDVVLLERRSKLVY